jgi:hypothetical protein
MSRKRKTRSISRTVTRMNHVRFVEAPPEPGRFFVMFLDDGVSPGKLVTGTDFREEIPREIERAPEDEDYVDALKRAYTWFEKHEKRQQD